MGIKIKTTRKLFVFICFFVALLLVSKSLFSLRSKGSVSAIATDDGTVVNHIEGGSEVDTGTISPESPSIDSANDQLIDATRSYIIDKLELDAIALKNSNIDGGAKQLIPRIIHQTWKNREEIPDIWKGAQKRCHEHYKDWTFMLWTDESARAFIAEHYPDFLKRYDSYWYVIQRADVIRYFVIYHYGGIYMDMDVGCSASASLENLLSFPAIIPKTKPFGYSNDVLLSEPGHAFFKYLIASLPAWDHWYGFPYLTVFLSTGPMFLSINYERYQQQFLVPSYNVIRNHAKPFISNQPVFILHPDLYSEGADKFFTHHQGSTWHGWDAMLVKFIWSHYLIFLVVGLTSGIAITYKCFQKRKQVTLSA